ncbi:MAG: glycosyltransferase [Anaeromyxobacter sp.]
MPSVPERLRVLFVSPFPPVPATFGAQRRVQGLLTSLSHHHDVTAVTMLPSFVEREAAERGLRGICPDSVIIPSPPVAGLGKRVRQLRSLFSLDSYERLHHDMPELRRTVHRLLTTRRYDIVNVEFPFFGRYDFRQAPPGERPPKVVLDEHNVEFDLVRQMAGLHRGLGRHLHNSINWRKLQREEIHAWRTSDGVMFTSAPDEARARALAPGIQARVVPNAADITYFHRQPGHPEPDGQTLLFFGTFGYFPNHDGVLYFLREIWPKLAATHPRARLKLIGSGAPPEVKAFEGPRVELPGLVDDVRPHLAGAAAIIVPLRIGGGTRLEILEAMAMGKPIVTTRLGAEGIDAVDGRDMLFADDPAAFAAAAGRVLDDPGLAARLGASARALSEQRYSWDAAGRVVHAFYNELLEAPPAARAAGR